MARYPGARWRPVTRYLPGGSANQPMARYDVGVDHTYVGSPSPDAAFAGFNTSGNPIPHFMFFRDGTIDQYVDTKFRSSACLEGNPRVIAWETADGFSTDPAKSLWTNGQAPKDTPAMVQAKAKLMVWLNQTHGIPLVRCPSSKPTARGFGWHRLGIDGNFEQPPGQLLGGRVDGGEHWTTSFGKTCPTSRRIHQFVDETLPAAVALAKPTPAPATLTVIGWNCYVANTDQNVIDTLTRWTDHHHPDVFCLSEARTHAKALTQVPGYTPFQRPPAADKGGVVNDQGDSAILVRNDLVPHVTHHRVAKMRLKWTVFGHNQTHTPRQYEIVSLKKAKRKWRVRSDHWPTHGFAGGNRAAFLESATRSKAWLRLGVRSTSIDVGDLNDKVATVDAWFGKGFTVVGSGVDMLIGHRVKSVDHTELDKGGSDHHGQLYVVTAK